MPRASADWKVFRDPSWLHWALTVPLLAGHIAGLRGCLMVAITLCAAMTLAMWLRTRSILAMPVQLRIAYTAMLILGTAPGMFWIYYVQLGGTTAMLLFGYCPLARMLTLLPWNRPLPINRAWLKLLVFSPASGGLLDWSQPEQPQAVASCSCALPPPGQHQAPTTRLA